MSEKLCECGCGEPAPISTRNRRAQGHRVGEPMRFVFSHDKRKSDRYEIDAAGCWVWQNGVTTGGYGMRRKPGGGGSMYAHRYFYEQAKGPIPEGLQIDHLCRNRACVNPDHLEAVTSAENTRRGAAARQLAVAA